MQILSRKVINSGIVLTLIAVFSLCQTNFLFAQDKKAEEQQENKPMFDENDPLRDLKMSLATFQLASDLIDIMRHGYKSEGSKLFLGERAKEIYEKSIRVALKLHEITKDQKYAEDAFTFAEKSKVSVLLDALRESDAKQFAGISDSLLEFEKDIKIDLAFYDKSLAEEQQKGKEADSAKIALWSDKVFVLKQKYESLVQFLEKEYKDYYNLKYESSTITIKEIQDGILDEKTAMIEYFVGDSNIYIFTIGKTSFDVVTVKREDYFKDQVEKMRDAIISMKNSKTSDKYSRYTDLAYILFETLVTPALKPVASAEKLIIVPDGLLGYLPFGALLTSEVGKTAKEFTDLDYFIKKYSIVYSYSSTLMHDNLNRKSIEAPNDFIAYAPIDFQGISTDRLRGVEGTISSLPSSESEVTSILALFKKKSNSKVYIKGEATEQTVKTDEIGTYKYIHFATHGFVNEERPKLSGILFADDTTKSAEDGILFSGEGYNLNLSADLVVLSACQTGLGKVQKGEGIIGLTRGFLFSGASNLLVSLWRVADESTSKLMVDFYKHMLKLNSKSGALTETKRGMIANAKYAAPYYWAPFILIGQ
ncbi:MAG: CHAT domain-containing protein [Bacteroidia bacterium]|nr:CHAT domain-containing protein [Bacteroidia bacterium]